MYSAIKDTLTWLYSWRERKRSSANYRAFLRREIGRCVKLSHTVIRDEKRVVVQSPSYRFPTHAYLQWIDRQGGLGLDEQGLAAIEEFYETVEQINKGLDQAAQAFSNERFDVLLLEVNRNRLKSQRLPDLGDRAMSFLNSN